jgi:beta-galactosidase
MTPDRARIRADGLDLSFITVRVTDRDGLTVPRANQKVRFTVTGPGEIIATDNGDPTSFESFQAPDRAAFNGLCLVVVKGKPKQPGQIVVRAESASLQSAAVMLRSRN